MNQAGENRRSQRSEELLIHALIELLESTPYEQITVRQIVERANVGRSTFYDHFVNKDDLFNAGFQRMLDALVAELTLTEDGRELRFCTSRLYEHARGHYPLYKTLVWSTSGFELLTQDGHAALSEKLEARLVQLVEGNPASTVPLPVLAYSLAGSLLVMLKWWLDHRMPYSPEEMDAIFQALILPGMEASLRL